MMEEAEKKDLGNYLAVGRFFRAYHLTQMTLTFGDIPYSESMQGEADLFKPRYDSQQEVFNGILQELAIANEHLGSEGGEITGENIIYDGDILKMEEAH